MGLLPFGGARGRSRRRFWLRPVSREYSEALGEFAELGAGPQAGELEQVAGDIASDAMGAGLLGRDLLGLLQVVDGLADLPSHGGGCGEGDQGAGPALGGQKGDVDGPGPIYRPPTIAQDDGDHDG